MILLRWLLPLSAVLMIACDAWGQISPPEVLPAEFNQPVDLKHAGDDRLFVVEKAGRIWIMDKEGTKSSAAFLDISDRVNAGANERGLLGLAFHPDFASNGRFFVNYTGTGGHTRISRFELVSGSQDKADPASEMIVMQVNQPFNNHNAGDLAFGPDGFLYIPLGDGGSAGDPGNRSQDPKQRLGKILRIDVDGASPFGIPADNPYAGSADTLPEIWAFGLRNPWRFSFDSFTGDLWIADVGQGEWEEINMEPAGSKGGMNWGWRCYEGFAPYNLTGCGPTASYDPPVHVYPNVPSVGCSVTGGYVYRGAKHPALTGKYFFADFCSGRIWTLTQDSFGGWTSAEVFKGLTQEYVAFGQDNEGELYLVALGEGRVFRLAAPCALNVNVSVEDALCEGECSGTVALDFMGGCPPYLLVLNGGDSLLVTENTVLEGLCAGSYSILVSDCAGCAGEMEATVKEPVTPSLVLEWLGDSLVATAGFERYLWYLNDSLVAETTEGAFLPASSGIWMVEGKDASGCSTVSGQILVELSRLKDLVRDWSIYPNPFSEQLLIKGEVPNGYWLELRDVLGRTVVSGRDADYSSRNVLWQISGFPDGVYILFLTGPDGFFPVQRLVKSFKGS